MCVYPAYHSLLRTIAGPLIFAGFWPLVRLGRTWVTEHGADKWKATTWIHARLRGQLSWKEKWWVGRHTGGNTEVTQLLAMNPAVAILGAK